MYLLRISSVIFFILISMTGYSQDYIKLNYDNSKRTSSALIKSQSMPQFYIPKKQLYFIGESHGFPRTQDIQKKLIHRILESNVDTNCLFLELEEIYQSTFDDFISGKGHTKSVLNKLGERLGNYALPYLSLAKNRNLKIFAADKKRTKNHYDIQYFRRNPQPGFESYWAFQSYFTSPVRNRFFLNQLYTKFNDKTCNSSIFIVGYAHLTESGSIQGFDANYSPLVETLNEERDTSHFSIIVSPLADFSPHNHTPLRGSENVENTMIYIDKVIHY